MSQLQKFRQLVQKVGIQRTNRYSVEIIIPPKLIEIMRKKYNQNVSERVSLMARETNIPGFSATANEIKVGAWVYAAQEKNNADYSITFLCSGDMMEHNLFEEWRNLIFPSDHTVAFYDDYISEHVSVTLNDLQNKKVKQVNITEAWPQTVTDVQASADATNGFSTFQVTFKYRYSKQFTGEKNVTK